MAKLLVQDERLDTRIPFLRGMLIRSLQNAGLEFDDAFRIANDIRTIYDRSKVVTTAELRDRVSAILQAHHPLALTRYRKEDIYKENLHVVHPNDQLEPFSRAVHTNRLTICTLSQQRANAITRRIHSRLIREKRNRITTRQLSRMTYQEVHQDLGQQLADGYLIWNDFLSSHTPLIVLIGGVPGSGKSTLATELASRLNVVRTQSTDMLREVMRVLIPQRLSPVLHTSSFQAGQQLHRHDYVDLDDDTRLLDGFARQAEMVEVACDAVIRRAISEQVSIIIEGVHIKPTLLRQIPNSGAVVVPVMLGVLDRQRLINHLKGRSIHANRRRVEHYLNAMDQLWQLQTALLSEADNAGIHIVNNLHRPQTVSELIAIINQAISNGYRDKIAALRAAAQSPEEPRG